MSIRLTKIESIMNQRQTNRTMQAIFVFFVVASTAVVAKPTSCRASLGTNWTKIVPYCAPQKDGYRQNKALCWNPNYLLIIPNITDSCGLIHSPKFPFVFRKGCSALSEIKYSAFAPNSSSTACYYCWCTID